MTTLRLIQGDDETITIQHKDSDGDTVSIVNYYVRFTVKRVPTTNATDSDAIISVTEGPIASDADSLLGIYAFTIPKASMEVPAGTYKGDIQLTTAAGNVETWGPFDVTVIADITNRTS